MPTSFPSAVRIQGNVSGAVPGGATDVDLQSGAGVPVHSALAGSLYQDTTNGALYINTSVAATGTTWALLPTSTAAAKFQDAIVAASSAVTAKALTNFDQTITIPANTLAVADQLLIRACIQINTWPTKANATWALRVGGTPLAPIVSTNIQSKSADGYWSFMASIDVRSIGAKGVLATLGSIASPDAANLGTDAAPGTAPGVDTTGALVFAMASASSAGAKNSRTLQSFSIEVFAAS